jgi:hypothetical protein
MKSFQEIIELDEDTIQIVSKTTYTKAEFKALVHPILAAQIYAQRTIEAPAIEGETLKLNQPEDD